MPGSGDGGAFGSGDGGAWTGATDAAGATVSGCGSGAGGGGSTIFRIPRIRSPVGVFATRTGPVGTGAAGGAALLFA